MKKNFKILITGSTGFIGKNLKEYFKDLYILLTPNRQELDLCNQIAVKEYFEENEIDIIIHCANANTSKTLNMCINDNLDSNLRMFFNIYESLSEKQKLIYFGSGAEYGKDNYLQSVQEESIGKCIPKDPYGFSKYIMSKAKFEKKNIVELCLFGVYGKYEEYDRRFISNNICRALNYKKISVNYHCKFDYLWVIDLCKITEWFILNKANFQTYNVTTGNSIDLIEIAKLIREKMNIKDEIKIISDKWMNEYSGSNDRLLKEIGDFKFTNLSDGIEILIEYYKNNLSL